jgi:cytochrome P450
MFGVGFEPIKYYSIENSLVLNYRRRDRAHREIKNIFYKAIQKRRLSKEPAEDILQTLLDSTYK